MIIKPILLPRFDTAFVLKPVIILPAEDLYELKQVYFLFYLAFMTKTGLFLMTTINCLHA